MIRDIIVREDDMWLLTTEDRRLIYIQGLRSHVPHKCPECGTELTVDHEQTEQIYCPECGLVTQDSTAYVAGFHIVYPHGLRLG